MPGELVTEVLPYDNGRRVSVYVPADPTDAIVFAGDGELIAPWGASLDSADVPPTMVVGVHRSGDPDELARLREYSPSFDAVRFAAHEAFVVRDVREWVRTRFGAALPAERTAVCGVSAGGEFSLAMGLRHPDVFGAVFSASPGAGYRPPAPLPDVLPRAYLLAGTQEPFFRENAMRWSDALRAAGADVVLAVREGGHGDAFWADEFPRMVTWAFGTATG